ncbi:hypothetical protein [Veillonella sp.]|jgi:hypothetical protein|uniref:hypothetical protein n=1 Tax=Veillonella sp. TaxID=1926307 RepID=UPI002050D1A9|nr:hypothetical protein [Veillonella sp.]MBS6486382.1 hypothetical protein [Veillonella sp.]DAL53004.1 MAG TPA_asm: hypothetical protein [Caudoviricetes sp.]
MSGNNYLSYEEQFKDILNNEEIDRIENKEIREIRSKYWKLRHEAFLDERNISDEQLKKIFDKSILDEQKELEAYRR